LQLAKQGSTFDSSFDVNPPPSVSDSVAVGAFVEAAFHQLGIARIGKDISLR
jgi:hypothetical protein